MISVVVPCFNEAEVLPISIPIIEANLLKLNQQFEIIVVDDGSTDNTLQTLSELRSQFPSLRIIKLRNNSGHTAALHAGIQVATGDWCITMDCDLQDPPELLEEMYSTAIQNGVCLVNTKRNNRKTDTIFKRLSAKFYYKIISRITSVNVIPESADFRLMHRCLVDQIISLQEKPPVLRMIIPTLGFRSTTVEFKRPERVAGSTKYSLRKMVLLAVDSLFTFGIAPLRFILMCGVILGSISFLAALFELLVWLRGWAIPGVTTIVLPMLILNSFLLISVGLLGEYVGVAIREIRKRPEFLIETCPRQLKEIQ
jgi:glycosyltransferase involved in cell wall biosynthesis